LNNYYKKNKNNFNLNVKLQRKIKGEDPNVDYNALGIKYQYETKVSDFTIKPGALFEIKDYLFKDPLFNKERLERKYSIFMSIENSYKIIKYQFYVKRIWNSSNIDIYEYQKWLASLNISIPIKIKDK